MTKSIEQEFYEAFDIEPVWKDVRSNKTCIYTEKQAKEIRKTNRNIQLCSPPITDRILLEFEDVVLRQSTHIEYDYVDGEYWGRCEIPLSTSRGATRNECLLKILISIADTYKSGSYYDGEDIIYNAVGKIMGVEDDEIPF